MPSNHVDLAAVARAALEDDKRGTPEAYAWLVEAFDGRGMTDGDGNSVDYLIYANETEARDEVDRREEGAYSIAPLAPVTAARTRERLLARGYLDAVEQCTALRHVIDEERCESCEGDGEVSHGSCSVPDCEHVDECDGCEGTGKRPSAEDVARLRAAWGSAIGDNQMLLAEVEHYKERGAELERQLAVEKRNVDTLVESIEALRRQAGLS